MLEKNDTQSQQSSPIGGAKPLGRGAKLLLALSAQNAVPSSVGSEVKADLKEINGHW